MRKKIAVLLLLFLAGLFFITVILYPQTDRGQKFLRIHKPVSNKTLLIEGWIPYREIRHVKRIIDNAGYNKVIISGKKLPDWLKIYQEASLIYTSSYEYKTVNKIKVSVRARGTPADNVYPAIIIRCNNQKSDSLFVEPKYNYYSWEFNAEDSCTHLSVDFVNDAYNRFEDRNLFINQVIVNEDTLLPRQDGFVLSSFSNKVSETASNRGDLLGNYLQHMGVNKAAILSFEMPEPNSLSKTMHYARRNTHWLKENGYNSVDVYMPGIHSRRTFYSYKKFEDRSFKVGITSPEHNINRWARWYHRSYEMLRLMVVIITPSWLL